MSNFTNGATSCCSKVGMKPDVKLKEVGAVPPKPHVLSGLVVVGSIIGIGVLVFEVEEISSGKKDLLRLS